MISLVRPMLYIHRAKSTDTCVRHAMKLKSSFLAISLSLLSNPWWVSLDHGVPGPDYVGGVGAVAGYGISCADQWTDHMGIYKRKAQTLGRRRPQLAARCLLGDASGNRRISGTWTQATPIGSSSLVLLSYG